MEKFFPQVQSGWENEKFPAEQEIIDLTDSPNFREKSEVDENSNMKSFEEDIIIIDSDIEDDHPDEPIGFAHDKRKRIFNFKYNFINIKIQCDFIFYLFLISILKEASEKYFYEKKIFQIGQDHFYRHLLNDRVKFTFHFPGAQPIYAIGIGLT